MSLLKYIAAPPLACDSVAGVSLTTQRYVVCSRLNVVVFCSR